MKSDSLVQFQHPLSPSQALTPSAPWSSSLVRREFSGDDSAGQLAHFLLDTETTHNHKEMLCVELRSVEQEHREEQEKLGVELQQLKSRAQQLKEEISLTRDRIKARSSELTEGTEDITKLRERVDTLQLQIDEQRRKYEMEISHLEGQEQSARAAVAELQDELAVKEAEIRASAVSTDASLSQLRCVNDEVARLRECEDRWLLSLQRSLTRPVVGIEVSETPNPNGMTTLTVVSLSKDMVAEKAGVRVGDIITQFDRVPIRTKLDFAKALLSAKVGSQVVLQVLRHLPAPGGKISSSIEYIKITIAGAFPTGMDLESLRQCEDPEAFARQLREGGAAGRGAVVQSGAR